MTSSIERLSLLTNADLDILQLIAQQHSARDMSLLLNLSVNHIEATINQMMIKLGVRNTVGLIIVAITYGLIDHHVIESVCTAASSSSCSDLSHRSPLPVL